MKRTTILLSIGITGAYLAACSNPKGYDFKHKVMACEVTKNSYHSSRAAPDETLNSADFSKTAYLPIQFEIGIPYEHSNIGYKINGVQVGHQAAWCGGSTYTDDSIFTAWEYDPGLKPAISNIAPDIEPVDIVHFYVKSNKSSRLVEDWGVRVRCTASNPKADWQNTPCP